MQIKWGYRSKYPNPYTVKNNQKYVNTYSSKLYKKSPQTMTTMNWTKMFLDWWLILPKIYVQNLNLHDMSVPLIYISSGTAEEA
jgi:hypothetical protein